jgi:hypothetical protein
LIRTAGEWLPEMLPFVPPDVAPLLLPLKRCQPPEFDCGVGVVPRFGVAADAEGAAR